MDAGADYTRVTDLNQHRAFGGRYKVRSKDNRAQLIRNAIIRADKVNRFHDLLRRVDEALAQASARGGDAVKIADLAEKRVELERALTASEQAWFELSAEAEET